MRLDVLRMDVGLHGSARIAEAISGPTLPPETTATIDLGLDAAREDGRHGGRAGGLAGELHVGVEAAHRRLDLVVRDGHDLDAVRAGRARAPRARRTARRARSRSSAARRRPACRPRARGQRPPIRRARLRRRGRPAARPPRRSPRSARRRRRARRSRPASGVSSRISRPTVPWPAITRGRRTGARASRRSPQVLLEADERAGGIVRLGVDPAPSARARSSLNWLAVLQREDDAVEPLRAAPHASAIAWLPADAPATPRVALLGAERREPVDDAARLERARVLEELRLEREPGGERRAVERGVRRTRPRIVSAARTTSSRVTGSLSRGDPSSGTRRACGASAGHVRRMRAVTTPPTQPRRHPVRLVVTDDLGRSPADRLFRLLLALPHLVWVTLFGIAASLRRARRVAGRADRAPRPADPAPLPRARTSATRRTSPPTCPSRRRPYPGFGGRARTRSTSRSTRRRRQGRLGAALPARPRRCRRSLVASSLGGSAVLGAPVGSAG